MKFVRPSTALALAACLASLLTPARAAIDPTTYVMASDGRFGSMDLANGRFSQIGGVLYGPTGLGNLADGTLVTMTGSGDLWRMNTSIGASDMIGSSGISFAAFGSLSSGALYGIDFFNNDLYSINSRTAAATDLGWTGLPSLGWDNRATLALTGNGSSLFYFYQGDNQGYNTSSRSSLYRLNTATGQAAFVGDTGFSGITGAGFVNGTLYAYSGGFGAASPNHFFTVNLDTGLATPIGAPYAPGIAFIGSATVPVPEPGAPALVASGLLGLLLTQNLRKQAHRSTFAPAVVPTHPGRL
ncbi:MAG: hypothetical protein C5B50_15590 [Verrucomicrobia bacterium]|nr:MAG: hypothetical protein C5B50_15590 [Verrucomicrobiota bacterium]